MSTKSHVRVWVRTLHRGSQLRIEDADDAHWLLERLSESPALVGLENLTARQTNKGCVLKISDAMQPTFATLESVLAQIPGVEVVPEPDRPQWANSKSQGLER